MKEHALTVWRPQKNKIYTWDALGFLRQCETGSVHCMITSPPYWGLRDYGVDGQVGLEESLDEFITRLVIMFREARRVLHPAGTLWVNMGDSYNGSGKSSGQNWENGEVPLSQKQTSNPGALINRRTNECSLKPKDLIGQPWRLALALQADGWYLRSDIIWHKTNSMPESVQDRPTKNHEYVFLFTKSPKYYYDKESIAEPVKQESIARLNRGVSDTHKNMKIPGQSPHSMHKARANGKGYNMPATKNKRTVWTISTNGFSGAHFATFPEKLIEPMILAGCPVEVCKTCNSPLERITEKTFIPQDDVSLERGIKGAPGQKPQYEDNQWGGIPRGTVATKTIGWQPTCRCGSGTTPGIVLDMFMGSGTTALVALKNGRDYIGCDLNPEYVALANNRLGRPITPDMFSTLGIPVPRLDSVTV